MEIGFCSEFCFQKSNPKLAELKHFSGFLLSSRQQQAIGVSSRFPTVCNGKNRAGCGVCDICIRNRRCPCLYCDVKGTVCNVRRIEIGALTVDESCMEEERLSAELLTYLFGDFLYQRDTLYDGWNDDDVGQWLLFRF